MLKWNRVQNYRVFCKLYTRIFIYMRTKLPIFWANGQKVSYKPLKRFIVLGLGQIKDVE